jgi:hypothetical protein
MINVKSYLCVGTVTVSNYALAEDIKKLLENEGYKIDVYKNIDNLCRMSVLTQTNK